MSNTPQNQNSPTSRDQHSNQGKAAPVGNNIKKDEPTARDVKGNVKPEGTVPADRKPAL